MYYIDLDFTGLSFTVQPSGIASGNASNTNGLLKVLRDAKHYYKIEAVRKVGGTTDIRASYGDDKSVYAYRQITDEELVKSVSLIMADAFNSTSENTTTYGSKGSLWWSGEYVSWSTPIRYALKYKISDYLHKWKNLPLLNESVPAYFVLSDSTDEDRGKAADKKPSFFCYKENKSFDKSKLIPITVTGTIDLKSYSGIYKFALSDSEFNVEIWRDNERTFSKYVTGDELKYWSPMKIAGNGYNGDNSSYGWWED